jgi:3-methyladenine DNA glycosylase AlkC
MVSFRCITCSYIVLGNACPLRITHVQRHINFETIYAAYSISQIFKRYIFRNSPYTEINVLLQWSKANPKAVLVLCMESIQYCDLP